MESSLPWENHTICCIPHCRSIKKKNSNNHLSFFKFPAPERLLTVVDSTGNESIINVRKEWISKLNIKGEVSPCMKVCSLHFADADFLPSKVGTLFRRHIKCYAIPSRNLTIDAKSDKFVIEGSWENPTNCCVPHCRSVKMKNSHLSFFKFPPPERLVIVVDASGNESIIDVRQEWISKLNIRRKVCPHMRVCSLHFSNSDILSGGADGRHFKPYAYAIPSRNLSTDTKSEKHKEPVSASSILCNVLQSASHSHMTSDRKCYSGPTSSSKKISGSIGLYKEYFPPIKLQRCSYDFAVGTRNNTEISAEYDIKPKITSCIDLSKKCYVGPAAKKLRVKLLSVKEEVPCKQDFALEPMELINQMYNKSSEELVERVQGTENLRPAVDMLDAVPSTSNNLQLTSADELKPLSLIKVEPCEYDFAPKTTELINQMYDKSSEELIERVQKTESSAKKLQQTLDDELKPLSFIKVEPCEDDFAPETMKPINEMCNKSSEELVERMQGTDSLQPAVDMLDAFTNTAKKLHQTSTDELKPLSRIKVEPCEYDFAPDS